MLATNIWEKEGNKGLQKQQRKDETLEITGKKWDDRQRIRNEI